mgnify:CR=1 FL=1
MNARTSISWCVVGGLVTLNVAWATPPAAGPVPEDPVEAIVAHLPDEGVRRLALETLQHNPQVAVAAAEAEAAEAGSTVTERLQLSSTTEAQPVVSSQLPWVPQSSAAVAQSARHSPLPSWS